MSRLVFVWAATLGVFLVASSSAQADDCSGLSDCSAEVKIALALLAIALLLALMFFAWQVVAAAAARAAASVAARAAAGAVARAIAAEEAAAAAAISGAEATAVAEAAAAGAVSTEAAVASGGVSAGGRLAPVLNAIETIFAASRPTSAAGALDVIGRGVASVGHETGYALGATAGGSIVIQNVGNVITYAFSNGQILIMRGGTVLLNLIP